MEPRSSGAGVPGPRSSGALSSGTGAPSSGSETRVSTPSSWEERPPVWAQHPARTSATPQSFMPPQPATPPQSAAPQGAPPQSFTPPQSAAPQGAPAHGAPPQSAAPPMQHTGTRPIPASLPQQATPPPFAVRSPQPATPPQSAALVPQQAQIAAPSQPVPPPVGTHPIPASSSEVRYAPIALGATLERGYGRIVIDGRVGEGGMGIVWRGWLFYTPTGPRGTEPPEPIALKVLRPQVGARHDVRAFFRNEAEALRALSHPNIVRFHELFEWPPPRSMPPLSLGARELASGTSSLALAMEYVDGDTLEQVIARHVARAQLRGPGALPGMPFRRAWYYFQQLLGALAATHALGIVHRDVKPSNILIRRDGIVKLTDYGIARFDQPNAPDESNLAPGTGAYMSPEQVLSQPVDGRSDLYSAAIVLYEMLSGRTPFTTENKSEFWIRQEQVTRSPPPIRTLVAQAPPILDALFFRALAKDKTMRFDSAIEMGNAFREAMGLPDTDEWRAQAQIAKDAVIPASAPLAAEAERQARLGTLRDFLVKKYPTLAMTAA
ncbi:protein kinase domain-containing protein [Pendulispora albinea]|uniref:Protein kinase n=1 Tax=Pendulispora albinea TaxID=2741071 RepID=A0ABZ2LSB8_9BACT